MKKAKVTFDYEAQEDDELNLKVGDVITEVEDDDVGWCKGLLNGKRGVFPDNFVEMLKEEDDKKAPPPPLANKKPSKKKNARRFKVNFEYNPSNVDELSLAVGEIIEVLKDVEEGWAEGLKSDGKKGVFPTNFGEMIEGGSESEENVDTKQEEIENKQNEEISQSSQKKVKGIGFGNIFGDGPIKLRQRSIGEADRKKNLSTAPSKTMASKEPPKETTPVKPKKTLNYCKVMFDYQRDNLDEIPLKKGEIIVVLKKDTGDDGWWEGEKEENGKRIKGVFPDNFVVELTPDEAKEHERQLHAKPETEPMKETKSAKPPAKDVKKVTPLMPTAKPTVNNDATANDAEVNFNEPTTTEHTLAHVKRPGGPKNRRKPGAAERREKAAASETPEQEEEEEIEEETKPEPAPAPKKESVKRGVAVLPGLGGGGDAPSGETPSWLQNLKNRQSTKKPPPVIPAKEPAATEPPPWLANLKKRQSSEFTEKAGKEKPAQKVSTEKPANGPALVPSTKPAAPKPAQKPTSPSPTEKPLAAWQIERQQKTKKAKTPETSEEKAPEPPEVTQTTPAVTETVSVPPWKANLSKKAPVVLKSPTEPPPAVKKPDKPPVGTSVTAPTGSVRPKPIPPKGKPAPMAKPVSSSAVEELKSEVKQMKEEMEKMRDEMKKEILSLNSELQTERNHRISLEEEVRKLRQQMSPS